MGSEVAKQSDQVAEGNAPSRGGNLGVDLADPQTVRGVFGSPASEVGRSGGLPEVGMPGNNSDLTAGNPANILGQAARAEGITLPGMLIVENGRVLADGEQRGDRTRTAGATDQGAQPPTDQTATAPGRPATDAAPAVPGVSDRAPDAAPTAADAAKPLSENTLDASKVRRKEGYYQVAERLLGSEFDHGAKKELTSALRDSWKANPENGNPNVLHRGDALLTQNNLDPVLNSIKDPALRDRMRERLTTAEFPPSNDRTRGEGEQGRRQRRSEATPDRDAAPDRKGRRTAPPAGNPPNGETPPTTDRPPAAETPPTTDSPPAAETPPRERRPGEFTPPAGRRTRQILNPPGGETPPAVRPPAAETPPTTDRPPAVETPPAADRPPVGTPPADRPPVVETPPATDRPPAVETPPTTDRPPAAETPPATTRPPAGDRMPVDQRFLNPEPTPDGSTVPPAERQADTNAPFKNPFARTYKEGDRFKGKASVYWQGHETASGLPFNRHEMTAASREFPFGTILKVTNPSNGREVRLVVTDHGPFAGDQKPRPDGKGTTYERVLDISLGASRALGMGKTVKPLEIAVESIPEQGKWGGARRNIHGDYRRQVQEDIRRLSRRS